MQLKFQAGQEVTDVAVRPDGEDWHLTIDGQDVPLQAVPDTDGSWLVETHQGRRRLWVATRGDERLVFCDGRVHTLRLPDPEHDDAGEDAAGGPCVSADMPGKVVQVVVGVGDVVAQGQTVLIMESMKMETELTAAVAGTVAAVHVEDGQLVAQGAALVDIEPDPAPATD